MSWSERTEYFERLVELRVRHEADPEPTGVLSIEDAMIYAEAVMEASAIEDEPWELDAEVPADLVPAGPRTAYCTVSELRTALERWPGVAGSAGGHDGRGEHAAD